MSEFMGLLVPYCAKLIGLLTEVKRFEMSDFLFESVGSAEML